MKRLQAGLFAALLIAAAVMFWIQNQSQEKLRAEIASLTEQNNSLNAANENLSNRVAQANSSQAMSKEQFSELLKLRGEVGVLRNQAGQLGKTRAENQQLRNQTSVGQSQTSEITPEEQFQLREWHAVNAIKQLGLAMRIYSGDNNNQYATKFEQLKPELNGATNFAGNISLDAFEFMNVGLVNDSTPDMIIFRERVPRVAPNGWWYRAYGLADGSVQNVFGDNQGDETKFAEFEKRHSPPPNQ
jgi:myosin heavy subunit